MIISHKHKFIFIKTWKTAGTSLKIYLSRFCGPDDILSTIDSQDPAAKDFPARNFIREGKTFRERFFNHMPAWKVKEYVSAEIWNSYFKFCVERNPWDKSISHYFHSLHIGRVKGIKRVPTFDDYLDNRHTSGFNYELYTEKDNHDIIIVDRVIKYETLNEELQEVLPQLGIPFSGKLTIKATSRFRTDRRPYQEFYTEEQRKKVEKMHAQAIKLHGYKFDDGD